MSFNYGIYSDTENFLIEFRSIPGAYILSVDPDDNHRVISVSSKPRYGDAQEEHDWRYRMVLMKFRVYSVLSKTYLFDESYITEDGYVVTVPHTIDHNLVKKLRTRENILAAVDLERL